MTRLTKRGLLAVVLLLIALMTPAVADASSSHTLIQGSGSSWAANAINQWVADVANSGEQVVFTANGAAQGRKDFANEANDFGVSDVPFLGKDPTTGQADTSEGRAYAYLPIAAGGTSFPYHVEVAGKLVRNIRLSGQTVAKIFTSAITNWDDPAITKDNNGVALPSIPIIPVVHSEGAGVTNQFTRWVAKEYPSIWAPCNGGIDAQTEYFPLNCGKSSGNEKAQSGSDGVMNFIKSSGANGSIGMEEYSYPLLSNFPAAKLLNKAGYYTLPTQYNVAVALTRAVIDNNPASPTYLTQNLDNVYRNPDKRAYPLSSYVYAIIPTSATDPRMTTAKRQTVADFLYYSICQGQAEIGPIGYSSLPINLVTAGFSQIAKLKAADAGVNLTNRNVSTCHNPTFIAGEPKVNHLAQIAPQPPACDRLGAGPCAAGVGAYNGSKPSNAANSTATGGTTTGSAAVTPRTPATAGSPVGGELGGTGTSDGTALAQTGAVVPATLGADANSAPSTLLTVVLVGLFLLVVAVPAGLGALLVRRRGPIS
ncbi:MAG: phosphate transporter substrate-binding protein PhoT family [Marmoricola sp.]|nr:phosphate transporter substrate-binding protein PhoT family [Marmoricola sp.]